MLTHKNLLAYTCKRFVDRTVLETGHSLCDSSSFPDTAEEFIDLNCSTLQPFSDDLAPVRRVKMRRQPIAAWMDHECHNLRRHSIMLERRYRRTKKSTDRVSWEKETQDLACESNGRCTSLIAPVTLVGSGIWCHPSLALVMHEETKPLRRLRRCSSSSTRRLKPSVVKLVVLQRSHISTH